MKSMTGFNAAEVTTELGQLRIEIRSVNQKGLDIQWRLPRFLHHLESDLTKVVRQHLVRGRVSVSMMLEFSSAQEDQIVLDVEKCGNMLNQLEAFTGQRNDLVHQLNTSDLLSFAGFWQTQTPEIDQQALKTMALEGLGRALTGLNEQRQQEGAGLQKILAGHLAQISALVDSIQEKQAVAPQTHLEQMKQRLKMLITEQNLSEERLLQEAAHIADKLDVAEEVNRLRIHVDHVRDLMSTSPIGRKLDFMCQEFIREANTVGSKCHDAAVAHLVVELKAEVEKMREQVQNVE